LQLFAAHSTPPRLHTAAAMLIGKIRIKKEQGKINLPGKTPFWNFPGLTGKTLVWNFPGQTGQQQKM
jgi:hypothetical protein